MKQFSSTGFDNISDDPKLAVNRWGYVEVYRNKYGDTEYSDIKFIHQRIQIRMDCALMNEQECKGEKVILPFQERVLPAMPEKARSMDNLMHRLQAMQLALITEQEEDKFR